MYRDKCSRCGIGVCIFGYVSVIRRFDASRVKRTRFDKSLGLVIIDLANHFQLLAQKNQTYWKVATRSSPRRHRSRRSIFEVQQRLKTRQAQMISIQH
jgi:hypothetical protein